MTSKGMTGLEPALNEPAWMAFARSAMVRIAPEDTPPAGDGSIWVSDVLKVSHRRGLADSANALDWMTWGKEVNTKAMVPACGTIVIVKTGTTGHHVGFLVRQSTGSLFILGEGVIRVFPRTAAVGYRWPL